MTEPVRIPAREARAKFSDLIEDASFRGKRIIITNHDRDRCALVSMDDLARIQATEDRATKRRQQQ